LLIGTSVTLAIIPCGSGNGLSHHLHIPLSVTGAIDVINKGKKIKIDTATVNGIPFISIAGVGFDAKVADDFSKDRHRGFDTYLRYILYELVLYQQESYEIIADGRLIEEKALFISFANSNEQGYNLPISPHADLQDGKVDICVIKKPNFFELPIVGGHLLARKMDQAPNVEIIQTSMAKISRQKPGLVNIDGEPVMMDKDLEICVNPQSLNILVNEK
jgi:Sphingosine kinase and enzymes related to eukaryotic diacylglycerol kinase